MRERMRELVVAENSYDALRIALRFLNQKLFEFHEDIGDEDLEPLSNVRTEVAPVLKVFMPYADNVWYKMDGSNVFIKVRFYDGHGNIRFAHIYLGQNDNLDLTLSRRGKIFSLTYEEWQRGCPGLFQYRRDGIEREKTAYLDNLIRRTITKIIQEINQYNLSQGRRDIENQLKDLFEDLFFELGLSDENDKCPLSSRALKTNLGIGRRSLARVPSI